MPDHTPLLSVDNLTIDFSQQNGRLRAVDSVSLQINAGETLGIVGESGSGKSVLCQTLMRLPESPPAFINTGSIRFRQQELVEADEKTLGKLRGNHISMVFQEPMTALNPYHRIGDQLIEPLLVHRSVADKARLSLNPLYKRGLYRRAAELLALVNIRNPDHCLQQYPHELSGGMRQRVLLAMALISEPELLIADEPTTALDVTVQVEIIELIRSLQHQLKFAMIFVSHDFNVIKQLCDRLIVMRKGRIVEQGSLHSIIEQAEHPYTHSLLQAARLDSPVSGTKSVSRNEGNLLTVQNLTVSYDKSPESAATVNDISFALARGQVLALVGESGSGKSTICRAIMQLAEARGGSVNIGHNNLLELSPRAVQRCRRQLQMIFQDPYASLNPRYTVRATLAEPLTLHQQLTSSELDRAIEDLLFEVELDSVHAGRYPHQLSGGQRQRVAIARALASQPDLLIADEPVSALDVTIQEKILNLLMRLCQTRNIGLLLVSHDLGVVNRIADHIAVVYDGEIVEYSDKQSIFETPRHAYTKTLLSAYRQLQARP